MLTIHTAVAACCLLACRVRHAGLPNQLWLPAASQPADKVMCPSNHAVLLLLLLLLCPFYSESGMLGCLTKCGYLQLSNLRAYPARQLHRLCVLLREKDAQQALGETAVQLLIRQAVSAVVCKLIFLISCDLHSLMNNQSI
jgi:hypothetical protein